MTVATKDPARPTSYSERRADDRARAAAALAARDFPILPTSDANATPAIDAEAGDNLTPAQRLAVAAIVAGETFAAAARAAGVTPRTLYAWRRSPAFRGTVERLSRESLDVVVVRVRNLMLRATRVLADAMRDAPADEAGRHAMRILNSSRLWTVLREPAADDPDEAAITEDVAAAPTATATASADDDQATIDAGDAGKEEVADESAEPPSRDFRSRGDDEMPREIDRGVAADTASASGRRRASPSNADGTARAVPCVFTMSS